MAHGESLRLRKIQPTLRLRPDEGHAPSGMNRAKRRAERERGARWRPRRVPKGWGPPTKQQRQQLERGVQGK